MRNSDEHSVAPRELGFSLIEVMIVIVCLAIMAAMALPMLSQPDAQRLRGAAQMLTADLAFAQVASLSDAADPCRIVFDANEHSYRLSASSAPDEPIVHPGDNQPYVVRFGEGRAHHLPGVTLGELTLGDDDALQFGAFGQLDQTTPADITLIAGGRSLTITLDPVTGEAVVGAVE